jgi:hypothetical protein
VRAPYPQPHPVRRRLKRARVELLGQASLSRSTDGWCLLDLESDDTTPTGPLDLVVLAGHRRARHYIVEELHVALPGVPIQRVGDALAPRTLLDAVTEGAWAGRAASSTPLPDVAAVAGTQ